MLYINKYDLLDPEYKFLDQFLAIFKRKLFFTIKSPTMIVLTLLPLFFIFMGVYGAKFIYNQTLQKDSTNANANTKDAVDVITHSIFFILFITRLLWLV